MFVPWPMILKIYCSTNLTLFFPAMYSVFMYLHSFLVFKASQNVPDTFDRTVVALIETRNLEAMFD